MTSRLLTLVFPQWQGSGKRKFVHDGAQVVRGLLPAGAAYTGVPVSEDMELTRENGIWGYRQITSQLADAHAIVEAAGPEKIFLIGGDCGTEVAPVSYLNEEYGGDLAVLWLDAHGDLNSPATSVTGNFHGMPLRCLLGDGDECLVGMAFSMLRAHQVIMGGTRDLDPPEAEYIGEQNISVIRVGDIERDVECVSRLVAAKGYHNLYVHIDLDVLDSGKCPWGLCLTPDGLGSDTLMALLRDLKNKVNIAGISIVELRPSDGMDLAPLRDLVDFCRNI